MLEVGVMMEARLRAPKHTIRGCAFVFEVVSRRRQPFEHKNTPFEALFRGRRGGSKTSSTKHTDLGMLSCSKCGGKASSTKTHHSGVCFRVRSGDPGGGNPLNTKTRHSRRVPCSNWASRWRQDLEHKNTPIRAWFRALSGRQGDRRASNLKTHPLGRDFVLEVGGPGGGKASNTKHTT